MDMKMKPYMGSYMCVCYMNFQCDGFIYIWSQSRCFELRKKCRNLRVFFAFRVMGSLL